MRPIAYEFQCLKTGHCYVDYVKRTDIEERGEIYTPKPLYYEAIRPIDLMEVFDQNPDFLNSVMSELRKRKLEKIKKTM